VQRQNTYQMEEEGSSSSSAQTPRPSVPQTSVSTPSVEQLMGMMMNLMQNMQTQQASSSVRQPFNVTLPETYNGARSPKIIDSWLFSIREYCENTHLANEHIVAFAGSLLRDNAKAWWRTLHLQGRVPATFDEFENDLRGAFRPSDAVRSARNQLAALLQRGSVQSYAVRFRDLMLEIPDITEAEALDRFIRGLREKTRLEVEHRDPMTLEEAIIIAERYDSIIFSPRTSPSWRPTTSRTYTPGPTPMEIDNVNARPPPNRSEDPEKIELRRRGACFFCKKVGHIARYCPEKSQKYGGGSGNGTSQ
jgi:Retrotransposon gag protein